MIGTSQERLDELNRMYPKWENDTLWSRFEKNAVKFKDHIFISYKERKYTYAEALKEVNTLAKSCYMCGMSRQHVALLLYNSPVYIFLTFALAKIGAVKVPVNMKLSEEEKEYIIRQSDCNFVIGQTLEKIPQTLAGRSDMQCFVICSEEEKAEGKEGSMGWMHFREIGQKMQEEIPSVLQNPDAISDILYTSGSTTFPKGVMLTHDMLLRSSFATCYTRRMEIGRKILVPIPLYHIFAYNEGLLAALWAGGCVVLTDQKATGKYVRDLLKKSHANDIICVPIIMIRLLEALDEAPEVFPDFHAGYWASTCPDWVWDEAKKKLNITDVTTGYGMTECGSTTTLFSPGCTTEDLIGHQGFLKNCGCAGSEKYEGKLLEIQIRDIETRKVLPAGQSGELYCRGLTVTKGYYHNPEENAACFAADGWFATGDMGMLDEKGCFTFQGRKNLVYKINGENVSPQHLNYIIGSCRKVKAVESIGIANSRYGEVGVAFIEMAENTTEARKEVQEYMNRHLASFQIPKYIVLGDSSRWPRTSCGKISPGKLKKTAAISVESYEKVHTGVDRKESIWI